MSGERKSKLEMISSTDIPSAGTPVRASVETKLGSAFHIEANSTNQGKIFLSDTETNAAVGLLSHTLNPEDYAIYTGDPAGGGQFYDVDLKDIWLDAEVDGDGVVISRTSTRPKDA